MQKVPAGKFHALRLFDVPPQPRSLHFQVANKAGACAVCDCGLPPAPVLPIATNEKFGKFSF
jgi:hypothetical protein